MFIVTTGNLPYYERAASGKVNTVAGLSSGAGEDIVFCNLACSDRGRCVSSSNASSRFWIISRGLQLP